MQHKLFILTFGIGCLLIIFMTGCGADSDDQIDEPINNLPLVRKLMIPDDFAPEETIELQIIVHDPDDDTLSYTWHVTAGKLDSTTARTVKWTAPSDVRSVTVTVRVNDGPDSAITRSKTVTYVSERLPDVQLERIIPGKQAAGVKLGDPFNTVKALYGKQDDPIGKNRFFSYWRETNIGLSGFVDNSNRVASLFIRRPNKAKTDGGIGVGSSLKRVESEFGPAEEIGAPNNKHWYWTKGIEFSYNADLSVESIFIFEPIGAAPPKRMLTLNPKLQKTTEIILYQKLHPKTDTFSQ